MKVKKYIANTMHDAMKTIRSELGNDAVILNSKEIETGGFLGFFTKKQTEVIAAIDPTINRRSVRKKEPVILEKTIQPSVQKTVAAETQNSLIKEINQLKELVQGLNANGNTVEKEYPEPFQTINNYLSSQGVTSTIRLKALKHLMKNWYEQTSSKHDQVDVNQELIAYFKNFLESMPMGGLGFDKKVINIVGPTGVGKTTTIAKLAAHCVLKKQKKVALITTDTYRIAAVEQLRTYAKILNIPLEVAYSIDDFKRAISQFEHYDLVLVDSAGRNFRNQLYVEELNKVIDFKENAETYLVLSLVSKYEDMKDIVHQFDLIPIKKVILTKKDETSTYGAMLNIPLELGKGIAYVTIGQNVPDDIVEASVSYILDCLFSR
ncbi:flagellar biosynthesis protein FlhF [Halalkalibacter alkalisediminis]|uniref:Flagellar biosynthesis protein FlhF n=1 Tax=Halalkalibacter alkalisediminis TaxID=935616 RepID=A0ABV6NCT5_9BACI|nr:flagellar biosynthesis protein FlhF [Halalkalibacter alkalisediminis]